MTANMFFRTFHFKIKAFNWSTSSSRKSGEQRNWLEIGQISQNQFTSHISNHSSGLRLYMNLDKSVSYNQQIKNWEYIKAAFCFLISFEGAFKKVTNIMRNLVTVFFFISLCFAAYWVSINGQQMDSQFSKEVYYLSHNFWVQNNENSCYAFHI